MAARTLGEAWLLLARTPGGPFLRYVDVTPRHQSVKEFSPKDRSIDRPSPTGDTVRDRRRPEGDGRGGQREGHTRGTGSTACPRPRHRRGVGGDGGAQRDHRRGRRRRRLHDARQRGGSARGRARPGPHGRDRRRPPPRGRKGASVRRLPPPERERRAHRARVGEGVRAAHEPHRPHQHPQRRRGPRRPHRSRDPAPSQGRGLLEPSRRRGDLGRHAERRERHARARRARAGRPRRCPPGSGRGGKRRRRDRDDLP